MTDTDTEWNDPETDPYGGLVVTFALVATTVTAAFTFIAIRTNHEGAAQIAFICAALGFIVLVALNKIQ